jgi:ribosomal protein S18 acetylase RimI-like enzyme
MAAGQVMVVTLTGRMAGLAVGGLIGPLCELAAAAFAAPPWNETPAHARQLAGRMLADAEHGGFVLAVAFLGRGPGLAGFSYGVCRRPAPGSPADQLGFAGTQPFEFCELAVRPCARGVGAGRALHDAVLAASGPRPRWLTTHPAAGPAIGLYRARGWRITRLFPGAADGSTRLLMARPR